eukprot:scaffold11060_cov63-Phaeocystis_antarctica.AAC.1
MRRAPPSARRRPETRRARAWACSACPSRAAAWAARPASRAQPRACRASACALGKAWRGPCRVIERVEPAARSASSSGGNGATLTAY